jgi:hypothetical protein
MAGLGFSEVPKVMRTKGRPRSHSWLDESNAKWQLNAIDDSQLETQVFIEYHAGSLLWNNKT